MAIKGVGNGQTPYDGIKIQRENERGEDGARGVKNPARGGDEVVLSEDARLMSVARKAIENTPETRADKVARLKAMVQDGTYKADAADIAQRVVAEDLELLK